MNRTVVVIILSLNGRKYYSVIGHLKKGDDAVSPSHTSQWNRDACHLAVTGSRGRWEVLDIEESDKSREIIIFSFHTVVTCLDALLRNRHMTSANYSYAARFSLLRFAT